MGRLHEPTPTPVERLAAQLERPDADAIRSRAVEVFGDEVKASSWMTTPRSIFDGRTPEELVASGSPAEQRKVLEVLLRIDYGVFS
jgi:uncharacterized protein (DUF2384 family)